MSNEIEEQVVNALNRLRDLEGGAEYVSTVKVYIYGLQYRIERMRREIMEGESTVRRIPS